MLPQLPALPHGPLGRVLSGDGSVPATASPSPAVSLDSGKAPEPIPSPELDEDSIQLAQETSASSSGTFEIPKEVRFSTPDESPIPVGGIWGLLNMEEFFEKATKFHRAFLSAAIPDIKHIVDSLPEEFKIPGLLGDKPLGGMSSGTSFFNAQLKAQITIQDILLIPQRSLPDILFFMNFLVNRTVVFASKLTDFVPPPKEGQQENLALSIGVRLIRATSIGGAVSALLMCFCFTVALVACGLGLLLIPVLGMICYLLFAEVAFLRFLQSREASTSL